MSPFVAIAGTIVFVSAIFTIVIMVIRYLARKLEAETLAQKRADEHYRAAKKSDS